MGVQDLLHRVPRQVQRGECIAGVGRRGFRAACFVTDLLKATNKTISSIQQQETWLHDIIRAGMSQPRANNHTGSSHPLLLPPSHQTNTHPEYAGPATTLTCCFAKALTWGRQSKPSVFMPCSKTSRILLQLTAPSQGRAMCWTFPFIPAGAKAGSGIYLPSLFLEKIKTT